MYLSKLQNVFSLQINNLKFCKSSKKVSGKSCADRDIKQTRFGAHNAS